MNGLKKPVKTQTESTEISFISKIEKREKHPAIMGYFGGSVWEPLPKNPDKQYMHVFHKKQPDLNWENPQSKRRNF